MSEKKEHHGMSFTSVLTIIFIVLKLTHYINWSWWWVLSPLWITASLIIVFLIILIIFPKLFLD